MKKLALACLLFGSGATAGVFVSVIKETSWVENVAAGVVLECKNGSTVVATHTVTSGKTFTGLLKIVGRESDSE